MFATITITRPMSFNVAGHSYFDIALCLPLCIHCVSFRRFISKDELKSVWQAKKAKTEGTAEGEAWNRLRKASVSETVGWQIVH